MTGGSRWLAGGVGWLARHWLALLLLGTGVFVALPFAAPVLAATGHERASTAIYVAYRLTCHQLPQRSWFLGGTSATHDWDTVRAFEGLQSDEEALAFHRPIRDETLGYQVAFCQRDTAIYLSFLAVGLAFAFVRRRRTVRALPLRGYLLALVPIGVDGLAQLVGLHESTPLLRTVTGAIFGAATALLVLPQLDLGMSELAESVLGISR